MRLLVGDFKILQQSLRVRVAADDAPREPAAVLRVQLVEPLHDTNSACVLVLRENNALAQAVAARDADAVLHQILQNRVGTVVSLKTNSLSCAGGMNCRHLAVLREILLVALLILVRQIVVGYPLFEELRPHLAVVVRHEHPVGVFTAVS